MSDVAELLNQVAVLRSELSESRKRELQLQAALQLAETKLYMAERYHTSRAGEFGEQQVLEWHSVSQAGRGCRHDVESKCGVTFEIKFSLLNKANNRGPAGRWDWYNLIWRDDDKERLAGRWKQYTYALLLGVANLDPKYSARYRYFSYGQQFVYFVVPWLRVYDISNSIKRPLFLNAKKDARRSETPTRRLWDYEFAMDEIKAGLKDPKLFEERAISVAAKYPLPADPRVIVPSTISKASV